MQNHDVLLLQTKQPTIGRVFEAIVIVSPYGFVMDAYWECIVRLNDLFFISNEMFLFSVSYSYTFSYYAHGCDVRYCFASLLSLQKLKFLKCKRCFFYWNWHNL